MLLAKTLSSTTFKHALIAIGTFGVIASAIFSYVHLSTSSYVRGPPVILDHVHILAEPLFSLDNDPIWFVRVTGGGNNSVPDAAFGTD